MSLKKIKTFKILWHYIKEDKLKLILYIFLVAVSYFPSLFAAVFWGILVEALTQGNFQGFVVFLALYEGVYVVFYALLQVPRDYLYNYLEIKFMKNVSQDLYRKIDSLPAIAFEDIGVGDCIMILIVLWNYYPIWFVFFVARLSLSLYWL